MPEGSEDATILIATSWQALKRAKAGDERTMITNCAVVIVFAGFFYRSKSQSHHKSNEQRSGNARFHG